MLTNEGFEMQIGVNHMGHFLLTNLLLDYLKLSTPSRIVNVSSIAHTRGEINTADLNSEKSYDEAKAYEQSKLANVLFTLELAKRLEGSGVTANSLHPGIVDTELMRHMGIFNSFFAKIFVYPFIWPFMKTPVSGAQTSLYCALDPSLEKVTGHSLKIIDFNLFQCVASFQENTLLTVNKLKQLNKLKTFRWQRSYGRSARNGVVWSKYSPQKSHIT